MFKNLPKKHTNIIHRGLHPIVFATKMPGFWRPWTWDLVALERTPVFSPRTPRLCPVDFHMRKTWQVKRSKKSKVELPWITDLFTWLDQNDQVGPWGARLGRLRGRIRLHGGRHQWQPGGFSRGFPNEKLELWSLKPFRSVDVYFTAEAAFRPSSLLRVYRLQKASVRKVSYDVLRVKEGLYQSSACVKPALV